MGVCVAVEAVVLLVSAADCAGIVTRSTVFVFAQTVVTVETRAVRITEAGIICSHILDPLPGGITSDTS